MKALNRNFLLLCGIIFLFATTAHAAAITWTLQGVNFNVNGIGDSMTGTFDYDFSTGKYSNVNLSSTTTGALTNPKILSFSGGQLLEVVSGTGDLTGDLEMFLSFKKSLYAPLVTIAVSQAGVGYCQDSACGSTNNSIGFGNGTGLGSVTTSPTPEPGSLLLCGSALIGFAYLRNRRRLRN